MRLNNVHIAIILAILFIAIIGFAQPFRNIHNTGSSVLKQPPDKTDWESVFDILIGGDSRVYEGIVPSVMMEKLIDCKIGNFGFAGLGFNQDYLNELTRLLKNNGHNIIILGISPRSMLYSTSVKNEFNQALELRQKPLKKWIASRQVLLDIYLKPYGLGSLKRYFQGEVQIWDVDEYGYRSRKFLNKIESLKEKLYHEELISYTALFMKEKPDETIINCVLDQVENWNNAGIKVYAFRTPAAQIMLDLENRLSSFDFNVFSERFTAKGGIWLTFEDFQPESFDCSHLTEESAKKLSLLLASAIQADR